MILYFSMHLVGGIFTNRSLLSLSQRLSTFDYSMFRLVLVSKTSASKQRCCMCMCDEFELINCGIDFERVDRFMKVH